MKTHIKGNQITRGSESVSISPHQKTVLFALMCREVVKSSDLIEIMWPDPDYEPEYAYNQIAVQICKLRQKLKPFGYGVLCRGYGRGFSLVTP